MGLGEVLRVWFGGLDVGKLSSEGSWLDSVSVVRGRLLPYEEERYWLPYVPLSRVRCLASDLGNEASDVPVAGLWPKVVLFDLFGLLGGS